MTSVVEFSSLKKSSLKQSPFQKGHIFLQNYTPEFMLNIYFIFSVAILRRTCQMLLQSGHGEKSLAIYQAVLEYNLFMPEVLLSSSPEDKKEFFDAFWESSAPRVGEIGALGWDTWIERKGDVELVKPWIQRGIDNFIKILGL